MKKILSIILSISLLLSMGAVSFAAENSVEVIDAVTAQKIATNFAIARAQSEDTEECFPLSFKVVFDEAMYDFEGNVSAYKFDVVNIDEEYSGYIITGAQSEYAPIIEYSTSGTESFIDNAKAEISDNEETLKVYYDGGFDYFIENTEENNTGIYDVSNGSKVGESVAVLAKVSERNSLTKETSVASVGEAQLESEWNNTLALARSSNPPTSGFISDPYDYETDYAGYNMKYIGMATYQDYINDSMSPYSNYSNACGVIAATNLMILKYNINDKTNLLKTDWVTTFNRLRTIMGHTSQNLYTSNVTSSIQSYFRERGYSSATASYIEYPTVSQMTSPLSNDNPQIVLVNGHYTYGDHFMLTLGYETYRYNNGSSTTYFRVADGWSSNNRYIYYNSSYMRSVINTSV